MANKISKLTSSVKKRLYDNFNRTNQSGVGTATDGSIWSTLRGSFSISANTVVGADANYPMITQSMPFTDVETNLYGTSQGSSAALWVTDSGNWWAVGMTQEPESCNCTYYYNTYYYYNNGTCTNYTAGTYNGSNCNGNYNASNCNSTNSTCNGNYNGSNCNSVVCSSNNASNCNNYACNGYGTFTSYNTKNKTNVITGYYCLGYRCSGSWNVSTCASYACGPNANYNTSTCNATTYSCAAGSAYNTSTCNLNFNVSNQNAATAYNFACTIQQTGYSGPFASCSTCYPQYIRILQSVGNTVSVITQWSIGTIASALKVKTTGSQITVSAYSDPSMITQIGSDLIYTPTGVAITPVFGITVSPSTYNQGYSTDSVEIKKN